MPIDDSRQLQQKVGQVTYGKKVDEALVAAVAEAIPEAAVRLGSDADGPTLEILHPVLQEGKVLIAARRRMYQMALVTLESDLDSDVDSEAPLPSSPDPEKPETEDVGEEEDTADDDEDWPDLPDEDTDEG